MRGNQYQFLNQLKKGGGKGTKGQQNNSASSTTDDQGVSLMEGRVASLEDNHRKLMNFYQHKIKELAAVIHKQTATKDSLTEELKTLSKESEEKKNHVAYLASKVHENFKTKGENHKQMVSSAYLLEESMVSKNIKANKSRLQLFTSDNLRRTLKSSKSERSPEDEYFIYKSQGISKKTITNKVRQNQRKQT